MGGSDILRANAAEAMDKMDPLVGNTGAAVYYGSWLINYGTNSGIFTIDSNKVTFRYSNLYMNT